MKIGIAGAGIAGLLLAYSFVREGCAVTIYDHGVENNCSNAAAGLLAPVAELEKNDGLIFDLGVESLNKYWPGIIDALGHDVYFRKNGTLMLAHARDYAELDNFANIVSRKFYEKIDNARLQTLEPELAGFSHGYYLQDEGQLDNQRLLLVLKQYLVDSGVEFKGLSVLDVRPHEIKTALATTQYDIACDCRGMGANISNLRSVRGELIWLSAPDISISRPIRMMHPRYRLYLVPRPSGIYLLGASEIESYDLSEISVRTMLELLTAVYCIHPKFAEARVVKTVTQLRPTFADNMPKIFYADGYLAVNGLYRHGFLIAPSITNEIMNYLAHGVFRYPSLWEKVNDYHQMQ